MSDTPEHFKPPPGSRIPNYQPAPGSRFPQHDKELLQLEAYMVGRINDERRLLDLPQLIKDPLLAAVARAHSDEMRRLGYFEHESPTPELRTISDRYHLAYGQKPRYIAENIAYSTHSVRVSSDDLLEMALHHWLNKPPRPTAKDVEQSHDGLMHSPGHRANILDPEPTHVGVGIIYENGTLWITQMFSRP